MTLNMKASDNVKETKLRLLTFLCGSLYIKTIVYRTYFQLSKPVTVHKAHLLSQQKC